MKDKNQDIGWLILLFIASCFFGFLVTLLFSIDDVMMYLITSSLLTLPAFLLLVFLYHVFKRHHYKEYLRNAIARGNYQEVIQGIDSDGKEMKSYWEWKLLALFHSGNIPGFKKLYQNYMNEINECNTLERYILSLLQDILIASASEKKPVNFMKDEEHHKYTYTKQIEYQLYRNLRLGLMEYYQPQKNLVKIYFDKFIQQADTISKPLLFYLYYLMTYTMLQGMHPQSEAYYQKTQTFIFDQESLRLCNEVLRPYIEKSKKGIRYENDMNREFDDHRRSSTRGQNTEDGMQRTFHYQQPSFNRSTPQEEDFAPRRHAAATYQNEFDALNATMQSNDAFQLYEENEFDQFPKRTRSTASFQEPLMKEEIDPDLDPTWFVRKSLQEDPLEKEAATSYQRNNPAMENRRSTMQQRSNPMQQSPFMNNNSYQDLQTQPSYMEMEQSPHTQLKSEEPAFINQRNYQEDLMRTGMQQTAAPRMNGAQQNPMAQQGSSLNTTQRTLRNPQAQASMDPQPMHRQGISDPAFQQAIPPVPPQQAPVPPQPQLRANPQSSQSAMMGNHPAMEDPRFDRFQAREQSPHTPINEAQAKVKVSLDEPIEKPHRFSRKKAASQDPFAFDQNPLQNTRQAQKHPQTQKMQTPAMDTSILPKTSKETSYKLYVKSNLMLLLFVMVEALIITIAGSSVIYNTFFHKYPISSDIVKDIIIVDAIVALLLTYLTAGVHTGYTIMKKSIRKWPIAAKIILSPILLVLFLIIGAICEVPYLIYAGIKSNSESK